MSQDIKKLLEAAGGLNDDELRDFVSDMVKLAPNKTAIDKRPETDDELHEWVLRATGVNITRKAATPHTNAPFEWFSDLFFERESSVLVLASRGAGKSFLAALFNFTMCYWFREVECMSVAAIETQAKNVYNHVKNFQLMAEKNLDEIIIKESLMSQTRYQNLAKYSIVTSSMSAVNGPHDTVVHRDEVELMKIDVFRESLNIEKGKLNSEGEHIGTRTLLTSTRKTSTGLMQKLLDECEDAEAEGKKPPYRVYKTNVYDVMANQPNCRVANPDLPEEEKCNCDQIISGEWEPGVTRTFEDACGGVLANAEGFGPLEDAHKIFMRSPKFMWEAQQENKRPYVEDVSFPQFSKERHGVIGFELDPANGPVFVGYDVGGTNPSAVEWAQLLEFDVDAQGFNGRIKRLKEGSLVFFGEIYKAEVGPMGIADEMVSKERAWKQVSPSFRVQGRFMDPQAKAAKLDLKRHNPPLDFTKWPTMTRDRLVHFDRMRDRVNNDLIFIDVDECPMLCEEMEVYQFDNKDFDHATDSASYLSSNVHALLQKGKQGTGVPTHKKKGSIKPPNQFRDTISSRDNLPGPSNTIELGIDRWRESLIAPRQNRFGR